MSYIKMESNQLTAMAHAPIVTGSSDDCLSVSAGRYGLLERLKNKETRAAYAGEHIVTGLPFQIHGLREKHGLRQSELAKRAGMAQERISKLEDPNYEFIPKIPTLLKLASVFDVPLIVKFGSWLEFFDRETRLSPELLAPKTFDEEIVALGLLTYDWSTRGR